MMTQSEIIEARQLIRPILAGQLSLCGAVYAPVDPYAVHTERIRQALVAFDRLIQVAMSQATQGEHIGLAVSVPVVEEV